MTISRGGETFEIGSSFTGSHYSLAVGAAFACAHQLGVPPATIVERIGLAPVFARCSVHRVENGPIFVNDATKAPHHSLGLVFDMMAGFQAPRKRIVLGQISGFRDRTKSMRKRIARRALSSIK